MEIFPGQQLKLALLVAIDSRLRRLYGKRRAGLNLNKTQNVFVPADEINISSPPRRAEVAGNHDVAQLSQIEVGSFLAFASSALMGWGRIGRKRPLCKPVQCAQCDMNEAAAGHSSETTPDDVRLAVTSVTNAY